ncbi:MAG: transposase [Candidatus Zixiibacteriota bacterium]
MVFVTTTVREWTPVFADPTCAETVLAQLVETVTFFDLALAAYVVMPTHLHAVMGLANLQQLSRIMQSFKSLAARRLRPLLRPEDMEVFDHNGRFVFWKQRFDDLVIWSEKQFRTKVEYIHNNPVRAGLVRRSVDYPYSSARDWLVGIEGRVRIDKTWGWIGEPGIGHRK